MTTARSPALSITAKAANCPTCPAERPPAAKRLNPAAPATADRVGDILMPAQRERPAAVRRVIVKTARASAFRTNVMFLTAADVCAAIRKRALNAQIIGVWQLAVATVKTLATKMAGGCMGHAFDISFVKGRADFSALFFVLFRRKFFWSFSVKYFKPCTRLKIPR